MLFYYTIILSKFITQLATKSITVYVQNIYKYVAMDIMQLQCLPVILSWALTINHVKP